MKTQLTLLTAAIAITCGSYSTTVLSARPLIPAGAILTITAGVPSTDAYGNQTNVGSGSFFGMDLSGNSRISGTEKTILAQGQFGIRIGVETTAGANHTGAILPGDSNELDAPWEFSGSTGSGQFVPGSGGPTETSEGFIDWTGFVVNWNENVINMGGGIVWQPENCLALNCITTTFTEGKANFEWSGTPGAPYRLQYAAVVPSGSFSGTQYYLHFEGVVNFPANDPPIASPFTVSMFENATLDVDIAINADDPDGNLDPTAVTITTDNSCGGGTIINNGDGTVTLPACTTGYTFDYTIGDTFSEFIPNSTSAVTTVTVNVSATPAVNTVIDVASTGGATPVEINVLANDLGGGTADPATVTATNGSNGVTSVDTATGAVTYTANASFSGIDTFTYTVDTQAGSNLSAVTTVKVTVNSLNISTTPGATVVPGDTAGSTGSTNGIITFADIGVEDDAGSADQEIVKSCIGGCFDFVLTGFTGTEAMVVLPLTTAIPAPSASDSTLSYRKLIGSSWQDFDTSGDDVIHTAAGTPSAAGIICPAATDPVYDTSSGLTEGHQCVRLTIVDDGPNDNDPTTGTIADPGGIAEIGIVDNRVASTSGCSMTGNNSSIKDHVEWLLVAGFIAMLGFFRLKRKA